MSITILKQGLLDTVQDLGRFGYQHLGINPNGAMDLLAAKIANMLVGNAPTAPVIECHFPASTIRFKKDCLIALAGADFKATINNQPIPNNTAIIVSKDTVLKFTAYHSGTRCYFAVEGGWKVNQWLNSASTNLKAAFGGFEGRSLKTGDVIDSGSEEKVLRTNANNTIVITSISVNTRFLYNSTNSIKIVAGSEYSTLTKDAKKIFETTSFKITTQSDRMGFRLQGRPLEVIEVNDLLSSAVTRGTIQLLPSEQIIILMADHQTTGGYPNIGNVISTDFQTLAQARPNEPLQFKLVTLQEAEDAYIEQQQQLQQLSEQVFVQLTQFFHK